MGNPGKMIRVWSRTLVVGAVVAASACSFTDDTLWPTLTGSDPAGQSNRARAQTAQAAPAQPSASGAPAARPQPSPLPTAAVAPLTETFVGKKVEELRAELARLQNSLVQNNTKLQDLRSAMVQESQRYHGIVSNINARLQVGTTPGNPILVQQFNAAQSELDRVSNSIGGMNTLFTSISGDSTLSAYLSESTRAAFGLSGAIDEDHTQLAIIEDDVNRTVVLVDRLLKEVADDIRRQTNYVATERSNLNLLSTGVKTGEVYGASLINRAGMATGGDFSPVVGSADITNRRPLVVVRFDRANVPYQQALYNAVSRALERRPNVAFDVVAVAPTVGGQAAVAMNTTRARRHAEGILRSLVEMGMPANRVALTSTTSGNATANEVHVYVR